MQGIHKLEGTRNAPTAANAAYFNSMFWDGRSASLEDQAQHPFVNPLEMGLADHDPILQIVRTDPEYQRMFRESFSVQPAQVTLNEVLRAIATFERTLVFGDSPFDRYYFGGERQAMSEAAIRGFKVFLEDGRCAKARGIDVDKAVLSDQKTSELGRFAVTGLLDELGGFKTSTLRNIAVTTPFMHDGSLATLREVVDHYNNGGVTPKDAPVNDFLSGGIRPLNLTETQITDLVAFLEVLTSPQFAAAQARRAALNPAACQVPAQPLVAAAPPKALQDANAAPAAGPKPMRDLQ